MTRQKDRNSKPAHESRSPAFIAWQVDEKGEKSVWTRIGVAWEHKDGEGYSLELDRPPANTGRIILCYPAEQNTDPGGGA